MITAPYNFVPINRKVVPAYWGEHISHDVPFEDGESGLLQVVIHTHSPLFVGDSAARDEQGQALVQQFNAHNRQLFIPGSSIKGMLRNVLEIMSFSKMDIVNDHRFAIRDLSASEVYRERVDQREIFAGWLRKTPNDTYLIRDCGRPGRISHRHLDDVYGTDFSTYFLKRDRGGSFSPRNDKEKAAQFKYERFQTRSATRENTFLFEREDVMRDIYLVEPPTSPRTRRGTIVFTGQPGYRSSKWVTDKKTGEKREKWSGHHLEFIFFDSLREIEVEESVMKDFFFAYHDQDRNRWSLDWTHWRQQLEQGKEIPVFFRTKQEARDSLQTVLVKDLGLSYMYKLPYDHSVKDAIPHSQDRNIDLAQAIFGFTKEKEDGTALEALKGRVHIGHAFALNDVETLGEQREVLSGPKASYYPNYIRQYDPERYSTFWDKQAQIAGWKRYPVHSNGVQTNPAPSNVRNPARIQTVFVPIREGAIFSFQLAYHNLRKVELGALLSAITFHNTPNTYHSLGMAKPLGYGKVQLEVRGLPEPEQYLRAFESFMRANDVGTKEWHESEQLTELLTMASDQNNTANSRLKYMELAAFAEAKKSGDFLSTYSSLQNIGSTTLRPLANQAEVAKSKQLIAKEKRQYEQMLQPSAALEQLEQELRSRFEAALKAKKERLFKALEDRKAEVQRLRKTARLKAQQDVAKEQGIDWSVVLVGDRKRGFESLKKGIRHFCERFYGQKEKVLLKQYPNGYLPELEHEELERVLLALYNNASSKDRLNWAKPFEKNPYMKKVAEWVGRAKAEKIFAKIIDSDDS